MIDFVVRVPFARTASSAEALPAVVVSRHMEPALPRHALVTIERTPWSSLVEGDVVASVRDEKGRLHRILWIAEGGDGRHVAWVRKDAATVPEFLDSKRDQLLGRVAGFGPAHPKDPRIPDAVWARLATAMRRDRDGLPLAARAFDDFHWKRRGADERMQSWTRRARRMLAGRRGDTRITTFVPSDVDGLVSSWALCFPDRLLSRDVFEAKWMPSIRFDPRLVFVAKEGDDTVGFAVVSGSADPNHRRRLEELGLDRPPQLEVLVVHPDRRGRGIGRALLESARTKVASLGYRKLPSGPHLIPYAPAPGTDLGVDAFAPDAALRFFLRNGASVTDSAHYLRVERAWVRVNEMKRVIERLMKNGGVLGPLAPEDVDTFLSWLRARGKRRVYAPETHPTYREDASTHTFVVKHRGAIAGFTRTTMPESTRRFDEFESVWAMTSAPGTASSGYFYVDPGSRNRNVGLGLILGTLRHTLERGADALEGWTASEFIVRCYYGFGARPVAAALVYDLPV
ncbi:MAG: GNAT family N-acetyltransferase [Polyangiaceae bacterium]